jgi:hypothetical protein
MLLLTAEFTDDHFAFALYRDSMELFSTNDPIELAEQMLHLGIENPLSLIDAARQWGAVHIHVPTGS